MKAVIVGGKGKMAKPFIILLSAMKYNIEILDKEDWGNAKEILSTAHLVLFSVPIVYFENITKNACQYISPSALLIDIASVKETPLNTMLKYHSGAILALHPMFGPNLTFQNNKLSTTSPLIVVDCGGRYEEKGWHIIDTLREVGFSVRSMPATQHDFFTSFIQGLHYFNVFTEGFYFYSRHQMAAQLSFSLFEHDKSMKSLGSLMRDSFSQDAFDELCVMFLDTSKSEMYFGIVFYEENRRNLYKEYLEIADNFLNERQSLATALEEVQKYLKKYKSNKLFIEIQLIDFTQCLHFLLMFFEALLLFKNNVNLDELRNISTRNYNKKLDAIFNIFGNDKGKSLLQSLFDKKYISEYKKVIELMKNFLENSLSQEFFIETYLKVAPLIKNMSELCIAQQEAKNDRPLISKL